MIQKLGKYTIVEKLGEGAMGAVYKAYDEILGRYVAVKTMAEDIKWDQELKLRFYREARSAASLQHPNIVIIHDLGEEGKITYIVMELLEGKDLKGIIRERERMPLESKVSIMAQVADGLNHAHQRGIIHRDVKPGNIHITPAGNVKILDFGIARIPSSDLTRSGVRLGTPVYMSPEQIRGGHYDERSDMFSTGIVFYEFLTYTHPFRDKNIVKTMDNILFQTQLPFAELMPDAPAGLWPVLSTCMAKEPEKRYGSMADVARACRKILDEMSSSAKIYLTQIEQSAPGIIQAAERPGAPATAAQLAQGVRDTLRRDERPSYLELRALHAALEREGLLGSATVRPSPQAPPAREETSVPRRDPTGVPVQAAPQRPPDTPAADPEAVARATAMFQAGQSMLRDDRPEEALGLLRQAMGILGPKEEYVQLLAEARKRIEERKKTRVGELLKTAAEALAAGQFTSALESVSGVLELEPDRADAIDLRRQALAGVEAEKTRAARKEQGEREKASGFKLLAERKFRESLRALQRARELLGEDTAVRIGMEEAEEGIRVEDLKSRVQSELSEGLQLLQADAPDKARARVNRALELSPRNPEALQLLARIDDVLERKEHAVRCAALIRNSRDALNRGSFDEAAQLASEAAGLDPESDAPRLLAEITEQKETTRRNEEVKLLLKKGEDALERFDYDEAELHADEAAKVVPGHPAAEELTRRARREREERRRKLELNEIVTEAQKTFLQGNLGQSEAHARRALVIDPENAKAKDIIARVEAAYEKMRKEKIGALLAEAENALAAGDTAAASAKARSALEIESQNSDALAFLKRVQLAEEKRRRDEIEALLARSRGAMQEEAFEAARETARQALALDASNKSAKALLKDIDKAERTARKRREKEEQDKAREQKKQAAANLEAPTLADKAPATTGAPLERTVIIQSPDLRPKSGRTALWIAATALVVVLAAAGGGAYWYLRQPKPQTADISGQIAAARNSLQQQNYDEAIRILQPLTDNPEAAALLNQAQAQKRQKEIDLLLLEAQNQRSQGLMQETRQTLQKVLQLEPDNKAALGVIAELDAADTTAAKTTEDQNTEFQKSLARAGALLAAGKLPEAQVEVDRMAQLRPDALELRPLRRQITARKNELAQKQLLAQQAAQRQDKISELSRRAHELFTQGKYTDSQNAVEQWLAEDAGNAQAQALKAQAAEASSAMRAYEAASAANRYDDALAALARLAKANPSDPAAGELNKRMEARKASAKAVISIFRLGEAASLFLDDQLVGTGDMENRSIRVGRHKIAIKTRRGETSLTRDFVDGENKSFVYDSAPAQPELREMVPGDREVMNRRAFREEVVRYRVEHTHGLLRGSCTGDLRISGTLVEYQGSDPKHVYSIPFRSLKLTVRDDRLEFVDVHNEKYGFKASDPKTARSIKERWDRLAK